MGFFIYCVDLCSSLLKFALLKSPEIMRREFWFLLHTGYLGSHTLQCSTHISLWQDVNTRQNNREKLLRWIKWLNVNGKSLTVRATDLILHCYINKTDFFSYKSWFYLLLIHTPWSIKPRQAGIIQVQVSNRGLHLLMYFCPSEMLKITEQYRFLHHTVCDFIIASFFTWQSSWILRAVFTRKATVGLDQSASS